jgi:hypothetical protein
MNQPTPVAVSAAHLIRAVVPTAVAPEPALRRSLGRIDAALVVSEAVQLRLPWFPPPERQETLAELVQAARRRLREDRVRTEASEFGARRVVVDAVLRGLAP